MHRSGTSLVGRLFFEAGADMGDPDTFYPADQWNPLGYYEQPDIHAINMPLVNGIWWKLSYFFLPSTAVVLNRAEKRAGQIRETAAQYAGKVIKETRYCLTLPAWLEHGATVDRIIICLRDPIQVARSIQKRNHTLLAHGYYMWRVHNERILQHVREYQIPYHILYYPRLLATDTFMDEAQAALTFFQQNVTDDTLAALKQTVVRPDMNHNPDVVAQYPPDIQALWTEMREAHARQFR